MHTKLEAVVANAGIWNGSRKESHGFLLSPSVYQISESQKEELALLGRCIYDCLSGLSHIATIAYDTNLNYGGAWLLARRVFSTGVPKIYQELQGMYIKHIPKLLKVDLMVNQDGHYKIAEIDGHNKHGLGYSSLGLRFRKALYPEANTLPGTVQALATEIRRLGHSTLKLLYADQERFYIPEFEIAKQELAKYGIECTLLAEMEVDEGSLEEGLFLDLPFFYHRTSLYDKIIAGYKMGKVEFIIPPKPFLGAKGALALLRNDGGNTSLEALLQTFIKKNSLETVRRYIPTTLLVGKQAESMDAIRKHLVHKRYVLKESISSGMKGTVFSDDSDFDTVLTRACATNMNWILQEEVYNQPQTFSWFEYSRSSTPEQRTASDWFMRVTVQYINRQLADVMVTARRDKAVHGAKDCIQIGTVIT